MNTVGSKRHLARCKTSIGFIGILIVAFFDPCEDMAVATPGQLTINASIAGIVIAVITGFVTGGQAIAADRLTKAICTGPARLNGTGGIAPVASADVAVIAALAGIENLGATP